MVSLMRRQLPPTAKAASEHGKRPFFGMGAFFAPFRHRCGGTGAVLLIATVFRPFRPIIAGSQAPIFPLSADPSAMGAGKSPAVKGLTLPAGKPAKRAKALKRKEKTTMKNEQQEMTREQELSAKLMHAVAEIMKEECGLELKTCKLVYEDETRVIVHDISKN